MENKNDYPSLVQQGKNLANFVWDFLNYLEHNEDKVLFVSDEVYKERTLTCRSCEKYDEVPNRCKECGCYIPTKAKIILDSCPLGKWKADDSNWEEKFNAAIDNINSKNNENSNE